MARKTRRRLYALPGGIIIDFAPFSILTQIAMLALLRRLT